MSDNQRMRNLVWWSWHICVTMYIAVHCFVELKGR